jgi:hypothetical protein
MTGCRIAAPASLATGFATPDGAGKDDSSKLCHAQKPEYFHLPILTLKAGFKKRQTPASTYPADTGSVAGIISGEQRAVEMDLGPTSLASDVVQKSSHLAAESARKPQPCHFTGGKIVRDAVDAIRPRPHEFDAA